MPTKDDILAYRAKYGRRPYWLSVLIAFDQFVNAVLWGYVDETLSSRAYRCQDKRRWAIARTVIDGIFFWEPNHCMHAYLAELHREHFSTRAD